MGRGAMKLPYCWPCYCCCCGVTLPPDALWETNGAQFNHTLDVPMVTDHAVIPGGGGVVVGVVIGTDHVAMVAIRAMSPAVWFSISVGDSVCSALTACAAGAVGWAAATSLISIQMILVASPLLLLSTALMPCPSTIVVGVLVIIVGLCGCGILGRHSVCICCQLLLHHHFLFRLVNTK